MTDTTAPPTRIVVGMDFSPAAIKATHAALEVAERIGATVHLVSAWQPPQLFRSDVVLWVDNGKVALADHARQATEKLFEQTLAGLGAIKVAISTQFVSGHAADVLTKESEQPGTLLLALGAHGAGWVERALIGSVTNQVLRRASCPVLTIRADD